MNDRQSLISRVFGSRSLKGISEIRTFFRTNEQPIFFIGPTAFNLLGIDRWVREFEYVVYYDSWDSAHPRVFTPSSKPYVEFESSEEINNYLLRDAEVQKFMESRCAARRAAPDGRDGVLRRGDRGDLSRTRLQPDPAAGLAAPPSRFQDRHHETRRGGRRTVGAQRAGACGQLRRSSSTLATDAGLGSDLVVQTPYGDSGKTTFFITSEAEWDRDSENIVGEDLKIMKRINNHAVAVEAVNTRHGTVVGPFMTDLTGYPELTPYRGGWCGNDLFPEALSEAHRAMAIRHVQRLGDRLRQEGYKGFFEVDVLVDLDSEEVYLGELNPRISGASSMTNVTAGAYSDIPLFLFHLLEFMDVDYVVDVEEINERWRELAAVDVWAQLIMKEPNDSVERILRRTGHRYATGWTRTAA